MGKNKDALMVQVTQALALGCGEAEISEEACEWFHGRYYPWIDTPKKNALAGGKSPMDVWDENKNGFFGYFRQIGKLAAENGGPIKQDVLEMHALAVERTAPCPWCPDRE